MGGLLNSIFDFLGGSVVDALEAFVQWLYQLVVVIFQVLYQLLAYTIQFLGKALGTIGKFFAHIWDKFFKGIFTGVWNALKSAVNWLEEKLSPVVKFLLKLRTWLQRYYNMYVRPILLMIQKVRQFLNILAALHIGIAQKLDQWLGQLQAKIVTAFATVTATINTLIDITNALMDPTYLLRKPAMIISLRRQIPAIIHAVTGRPPGYWFPSPKGSSGGPFAPIAGNFNFNDPAQNPPTSSYLGFDDGIGAIGDPLDGFAFTDGQVDQIEPLDYFNDDLYPDQICPYGDAARCLLYSWGITDG